mgnify:CR=1 FL=1
MAMGANTQQLLVALTLRNEQHRLHLLMELLGTPEPLREDTQCGCRAAATERGGFAWVRGSRRHSTDTIR